MHELVGRAVVDAEFRKKLMADPGNTVKEEGFDLTEDQLKELKTMNGKGLASVLDESLPKSNDPSSKVLKDASRNKAIHKDCEPAETVRHIKNRLARLGLSITEPVTFNNPLNNCWSCTIKDYNYPLFGANGKGVNQEYALASAYAEYIERLQCYAHKRFGRKEVLGFLNDLHPDICYVEKHELAKKHPDLFNTLKPEDIPEDSLPCLPFAIPFENKIELLPYELMFAGTHSNGMCAGNTPEEAISQGICEVMERYAIRMIAARKLLSFPTVDLHSLPLEDSLTLSMIQELESQGKELIVKDCTFNGCFPIVCTIIIDKKNDLCGVNFGSDPVFEVAFQRCITEMYQNNRKLLVSFTQTLNCAQLGKDLFNHPENTIKFLLGGPLVKGPDFVKAFAPAGETNKYYLKYLLNILRRSGKTIYLRDFSFLGFTSFYVFIPEMSICAHAPDEVSFSLRDDALVLDIFSQIKDEPSDQVIKKLADFYSCYLNNAIPFAIEISDLMERVLTGTPVLAWMDPVVFMAFIFIETKNFDSGLRVLEESENVFSDIVNILKKYCQLKAQSMNDKDILLQLKKEFQNSEYYDSLKHLLEGNYSSFYNKQPENAKGEKFQGFALPLCADIDGCLSCLCRPYCYKDKFLQIRSKILKEYHECNQHAIIQYINQLMETGE